MSKHRLTFDDDYDFLVFGISCHLKDHRVAWTLEKTLGLTFMRSSIEIVQKASEAQVYPRFKSQDDDVHLQYILISNFNEESLLLKSQKEYDYFIFVEGYLDIFDATLFQQKLQNIESFQFVSVLERDDFDRLQYIIFED